MAKNSPPLIQKIKTADGGKLRYNLHAGQRKAFNSTKRIILILAGARGGKSSFGPIWLYHEMLRKGPGNYLVAGPSLRILDMAAVPEVESFFGRTLRYGTMKRAPLRFDFSDAGAKALWRGWKIDQPPRIIFGHADDPDSLEAMTAKAAWLDEAGQKRFRLGSWEAIQRRLSIDQGRVLLTTTPYDLGWLKQKLYDPWEAAQRDHPDIDVITFDSTLNPTFPPEEFARARRDLPLWKFDMFYRGRFSRPAGLIYDRFDEKRHVVPRFKLPDLWHRYAGADFGTTNTAAVFLAEEMNADRVPTGRFYAYREYHPGKMPPETHVVNLLKDEPRTPTVVGGNPNEKDWRERFAGAGLGMLEPPVKEIEVGIDAVYTMFAQDRLLIMDDMSELLDELRSYSRVLDDAGEVTDKIDEGNAYHMLDALRYLVAWLEKGGKPWADHDDGEKGIVESAPEGVWASDGWELGGEEDEDEGEVVSWGTM